MPAAVAVPLITGAVSAGTGLVGAKMQSSASKNAAKTQSAAAEKALQLQGMLADRAMGLQGDMWGGIRQSYSPYTQSAPATLSALHEFLGIPGAARAQTAVPMGAYGPPMNPPRMYGPPGMGGGLPMMRNPGGPAGPGMMGMPPQGMPPGGMPMGQIYRRPQMMQG